LGLATAPGYPVHRKMKRTFFIFIILVIATGSAVLVYQRQQAIKVRQAEAVRSFVRDEHKERWVLGKTERELRQLFGDVHPQSGLLKHLHPYQPPKGHELLVLDGMYIALELKDGKVVKVLPFGG
jgi:hypothetical protein